MSVWRDRGRHSLTHSHSHTVAESRSTIMSLRLLPAFTMDNDEDDDGNFTKWMSSYWGHGAEGGHSRDRKRSFKRASKSHVERRASLPTVSQLDTMRLNRLHTAAMSSREEKVEVRGHQRARRSSSSDDSRPKLAMTEKRITTIPELTEALERRLCVREHRTSTNRTDDGCYDDVRQREETQEFNCSHHYHKEVVRRLEACRPRSSSSSSHVKAAAAAAAATAAAASSCQVRRKSVDGPISKDKEEHTLRRQFSLRRHR
ncbi:leukemia NUP98 fusion partner 1 [Solea solea]|uniref:leukemia NUP98 fusion partner 1 n=1 Tax=Solea solea TaxID=90069 RepID=UPI00272C5774|nr:leukemia NUP98 fusion partner 1 [Solea solea]